MLKADFSESQLQSATNSAYAREVMHMGGRSPFAFVPSLPAEFLLGWDTAFELDWLFQHLPPRLHSQHKGCNFFLQYKLSELADVPNRSKEWSAWNTPYFRFRIPHRKKLGGRYRDDFHQWDRLKEIADTGLRTYYATNTMIEESELRRLFDSNSLLDRIALLDIAPIKLKHVHASFANPFTSFALHSKTEEAGFLTFSNLLVKLKDTAVTSYEDGIEELTKIAVTLSRDEGGTDGLGIREQLAAFQGRYRFFVGRDSLPQLKRAILEAFIMRRFGLASYWYSSGT